VGYRPNLVAFARADDLIVSKELSKDPRVVRLLDTLSGRPFRREIESLGGYGVRESGQLIARRECA
jgi:hypothetical protein